MKGYNYQDYRILSIEKRKGKLLSNRDYCSMHPFNGAASTWIDDKLTLKYILNGTELQDFMPEYYLQIDNVDKILPLVDYPFDKNQVDVGDIVSLLEKKGRLALKKIKASLGEGFIKAEYIPQNGEYRLNDIPHTLRQLKDKLSSMRDYLVMELLLPHPEFAKYSSKSIGCLRYQIGRKLSGKIVEIIAYMRLGTKRSGSVENYNAGGILTFVKDGKYFGGHMIDFDSYMDTSVQTHPDNGLPIEGHIPLWNEIKTCARKIAELLPQLCYMGIDFCVTQENKVKILEINSLSSLDAVQLEQSVYELPESDFFIERLNK